MVLTMGPCCVQYPHLLRRLPRCRSDRLNFVLKWRARWVWGLGKQPRTALLKFERWVGTRNVIYTWWLWWSKFDHLLSSSPPSIRWTSAVVQSIESCSLQICMCHLAAAETNLKPRSLLIYVCFGQVKTRNSNQTRDKRSEVGAIIPTIQTATRAWKHQLPACRTSRFLDMRFKIYSLKTTVPSQLFVRSTARYSYAK